VNEAIDNANGINRGFQFVLGVNKITKDRLKRNTLRINVSIVTLSFLEAPKQPHPSVSPLISRIDRRRVKDVNKPMLEAAANFE